VDTISWLRTIKLKSSILNFSLYAISVAGNCVSPFLGLYNLHKIYLY